MNNEEKKYIKLTPFKMQVLQSFPYIDADFDALTNYELLCKVVDYLNQTIDNVDVLNDEIEEYINKFNELKAYVDNYFNNLDVQEEINNKLDEMATDGSLTNLIKNYIDPIYQAYKEEINEIVDNQNDTISIINNKVNSATSGSPLVASDISEMTDTTKIYVNTTNGHWYWYDGTAWQDGGVYQATGISDESIYPKKIIKNKVTDFVVGNYTSSGTINTTNTNWRSSPLIEVSAGDLIQITQAFYTWLIIFDSSMNVLGTKYKDSPAGYQAYKLPENSAYIGFSIFINNIDTCKIYINDNEYPIYKKYEFDWLDYNDNSILPEKLMQNKITDFKMGNYDQYGSIVGGENWRHSPIIEVEAGDVIAITEAYQLYLIIFDSSMSVLETKTSDSAQEQTYTLPENSAYIGFNVYKDYLDTCKIYINDNEYPIYKIYDFPWLKKPTTDNSFWKDKTGAMFGDSIVQAYYDTPKYRGYPYRLKKGLGFEEFKNYGESGKPIANGTSHGTGTNTKIKNTTITDFDLIVIAGGTNDFKLNVPLGTLGIIGDTNFDTNTFYGALRDSIEHIFSQNIGVRLCLWTPLQRDDDGYNVNTINTAGHKLIDYVNAIKNVGEMYSIPVCDMYSNSGITKLTLSKYTVDGLHPNKDGYDFTSNYYINFVKNI